MNVEKTVYLLFAGKREFPCIPILNIFGKPIQRRVETKFLGVLIDHKLSWKAHANFVHGKVSRIMGVMSKVKSLLNQHSLKTIYHSLVYPHIHFGIVFWGCAGQHELNRIFIVQKKIIRMIAGVGYLEHTEPLFNKLRILKVKEVIKLEMAKFIFSDVNSSNYFNFQPRNSIHNHYTRSSSTLILPQPRSNLLLRSLFYEGVKFFNSLPIHLLNSNSKFKFKKGLKIYLLESYTSVGD